MINDLVKQVHQNARDKGFYDGGERNIGEMLALIHSEVSEALEADRKGYHMSPKIISAKKPDFEEWRPVPFNDEYEVSSLGNVRSNTLKVWNGKVYYLKAGKNIRPGLSGTGYMTVAIRGKEGSSKGRTYKVAWLVAMAFIGDIKGKIVNHRNGDKTCDWVTNLELTSALGNNIHAIDTGLRKSKLSFSQKIDIALRLKKGETQLSIIKDYPQISINLMRKIKREGFKKITECFEFELADIIIRCFDMAGYKGIDMEFFIKEKMKINKAREYKHGKNY